MNLMIIEMINNFESFQKFSSFLITINFYRIKIAHI